MVLLVIELDHGKQQLEALSTVTIAHTAITGDNFRNRFVEFPEFPSNHGNHASYQSAGNCNGVS